MTNKFGITGVHCSGKTALANKLAQRALQSGKTVYIIKDIERNCPYTLGTVDAQDYIWHNQMEQEKYAMRQDVDTIICDQVVMGNLVYYHAVIEDAVGMQEHMGLWHRWSSLYEQAIAWMPTYSHVIRLPLNLEYLKKDDPIRPKDCAYNEEYAKRIDKLFDHYVEPFVTNHNWE